LGWRAWGILEKTKDSCPAFGLRLHEQGGPDHSRPVLHGAQAHAGSGRNGGPETDSIVADRQKSFAAGVRQADFDGAGPAMFDGVGDGFLGDAIEMSGHGLIGKRNQAVIPEIAFDAE
jgi:hypothetical protein